MRLARSARNAAKLLSTSLFLLGDRLGVHVLPKHYYTPVPDMSWLRRHRELWTPPAPMTGVHWDMDQQLRWVCEVASPYYREVAGLAQYPLLEASIGGAGYTPIDFQVLHCAVRTMKPGRIVEIGSGVSTLTMVSAARLNQSEGLPFPEINCIEPFPAARLRAEPDINLVASPVQAVDREVFSRLQSGDFLFIDSSHSLKPGSDLLTIYLDIVPNLAPGVLIHIHDMTLPYLYLRNVLDNYFAWQESALVLALLTNNERLQVLAALSALHYARPDQLRQVLTDYVPEANDGGLAAKPRRGHFPTSLYLRSGGTHG